MTTTEQKFMLLITLCIRGKGDHQGQKGKAPGERGFPCHVSKHNHSSHKRGMELLQTIQRAVWHNHSFIISTLMLAVCLAFYFLEKKLVLFMTEQNKMDMQSMQMCLIHNQNNLKFPLPFFAFASFVTSQIFCCYYLCHVISFIVFLLIKGYFPTFKKCKSV